MSAPVEVGAEAPPPTNALITAERPLFAARSGGVEPLKIILAIDR